MIFKETPKQQPAPAATRGTYIPRTMRHWWTMKH